MTRIRKKIKQPIHFDVFVGANPEVGILAGPNDSLHEDKLRFSSIIEAIIVCNYWTDWCMFKKYMRTPKKYSHQGTSK